MNPLRVTSFKPRRQHIAILLLAATLLTGCGGTLIAAPTPTNTPEPSPTNTPAPTDTPTPTDTPVPTDTPTFTPSPTSTSTPDLQATRAVKATATAEAILVPILAQLAEVEIPTGTGSLAWSQDKPFPFKIDTPGAGYVEPFAKGVKASNFVLSTDVTWEATGIVVCGLIFRSETNLALGKQYNFLFMRVSGLPAWAIQFHQDGYFKNTVTDVKFSDAIDLTNGSTNRILMVVEDEKFTVYVNGARQGSFFDYSKQRLDGVFGFIASQDSGESTCTFANTWIWALP